MVILYRVAGLPFTRACDDLKLKTCTRNQKVIGAEAANLKMANPRSEVQNRHFCAKKCPRLVLWPEQHYVTLAVTPVSILPLGTYIQISFLKFKFESLKLALLLNSY